MPAATLRVVTPARWLADDFAAAAPQLRVVHDLGLELPANASRSAWWCSTNFAARLLASGVNPRFVSPGPMFTADLPAGLLGRTVASAKLARAADVGRRWSDHPVHAKLAEAKRDALPAQVWGNVAEFVDAANSVGVPPAAVVQLSDPVDMLTEARCFVLNGQVVASSVYLDDGVTWDRLGGPGDTAWADGFASGAVSMIRHQPAAYTLDVARLANGSLVVVEANPAWSSNPYHCDLAAVTAAVLASQGRGGVGYLRWRWVPDPVIAARRYPLTRFASG